LRGRDDSTRFVKGGSCGNRWLYGGAIDPVTILASATAAYNGIKKAIAFGKDLESQVGQVSKWLKASSDMDFLSKKAKNPPFYKKFLAVGSIEEEAFQTFTHKKKMEEMRYDMMNLLQLRFGVKAKDELLALEGKIRKERQDAIYKAEELKQKIIDIIAITTATLLVGGFVFWIFWMKYG